MILSITCISLMTSSGTVDDKIMFSKWFWSSVEVALDTAILFDLYHNMVVRNLICALRASFNPALWFVMSCDVVHIPPKFVNFQLYFFQSLSSMFFFFSVCIFFLSTSGASFPGKFSLFLDRFIGSSHLLLWPTIYLPFVHHWFYVT